MEEIVSRIEEHIGKSVSEWLVYELVDCTVDVVVLRQIQIISEL
jgi:hypothetical protein